MYVALKERIKLYIVAKKVSVGKESVSHMLLWLWLDRTQTLASVIPFPLLYSAKTCPCITKLQTKPKMCQGKHDISVHTYKTCHPYTLHIRTFSHTIKRSTHSILGLEHVIHDILHQPLHHFLLAIRSREMQRRVARLHNGYQQKIPGDAQRDKKT
jgi:hypothetical protein